MSEYRFDRYRNGRRMAEGLVLTKFTSVDDAVAVVAALAQSGEIYVMRQDARIAELEAERDAAKAGEASEKSLHDKTIAERNAAENQLQCALAERDAAKAEVERLREKAEMLDWALDHVVDYGSRTLDFVGGKYVIETPLRLKDPADFAELDCDEWNAQYLLAALRAARGAK